MTPTASRSRSASGFRSISMRPVFSVGFAPSTPMNEVRLCTAGSCRIARASSRWRSAIAAKEIDWRASEMPCSRPVSCTGKNPFGTTRYSSTVSTSVAAATSSVAGWWSSTHDSQRP